jgi:hypothetical protein
VFTLSLSKKKITQHKKMSFSTRRTNSFLSLQKEFQNNNNNSKPSSRRGSGIFFPPRQETSSKPTKTIVIEDDDDFFKTLENQSFHDLAAVKKQIQAREAEQELKRQQQQQQQKEQESEKPKLESSQKSSAANSRRNSGSLLATTIVDAETVNYRKPSSFPRRGLDSSTGNDDDDNNNNEIDNSAIIIEMNEEQDRLNITSNSVSFPSRRAPQIPPQGSFSSASPPGKQLSELELLSLRYKRNLFDLKAATSQQLDPSLKSFDQSVIEALNVIDSCFKSMLQGNELKFSQLGLEQPANIQEFMFEKERNLVLEQELRSMMFRFA